jgi:citrate lyase subunit beta/citryl-CoA lyase
VRDLDGLARSCARGRELGHLGRAAIHPAQLPAIEQAYLPTAAEAERAREVLARYEHSSAGAFALESGAFVDAAVVRSATQTAAIADRYGTRVE